MQVGLAKIRKKRNLLKLFLIDYEMPLASSVKPAAGIFSQPLQHFTVVHHRHVTSNAISGL
jgi:hypothetical protein